MRVPFLAVIGLSMAACLTPPPSSERAADAARDFNLASRFGRMDQAMTLTSNGVRQTFLAHRAQWGKEIRVLDVELAGLTMTDGSHALVEVDYSWSRNSESMLRSTRVSQEFRDPGGGFRLVRERRLSGDVGLFGEAAPSAPATAAPRDVQFATKTIQ